MLGFGRVERQVDSFDLWHLGRAETRRNFKALIAANGYHMPRFQRRRCRCQHHWEPFKMATHDGNIAGMIAHAIFLLKAGFVRLIDDNQAQIGKGQEQG